MNKTLLPLTLMLVMLAFASCSSSSPEEPKNLMSSISVSQENINLSADGSAACIKVSASDEWEFITNGEVSWMKIYKKYEDQYLYIGVTANTLSSPRKRTITLKCGNAYALIKVNQEAARMPGNEDKIEGPKGYTLVWHDEFDQDNGEYYTPSRTLWQYQTGDGGWGNNELQYYVNCSYPEGYLAIIKDGILSISLAKFENTVCSINLNTQESWTYGYFEARLKLPKGKGTLPTFCLLPEDYKQWIGDGEINIMQEVGHSPNNVSSSIQCKTYNRKDDTQKTQELYVEGAQDDFHVYAVEWTQEYIRTLVDGEQLLFFENEGDGTSSSYDIWPFYRPFTPNLRLAWGGDWAGTEGLDESCLPAEFQIDYVRVFQKK